MDGIKEVCLSVFGVWTTPQSLTIKDGRLGALNWSLRVVILAYVLLTLFKDGQYLYSEEPAGYPTFWFESGDLYKAQNLTASYCDNPIFDYYLRNEDDYYWNNVKHKCYSQNYGEIVRKGPSSGFVTTTMKRLHTNTVPCTSPVNPCSALALSPGQRFHKRNVGNQCVCEVQQDYFISGVDKMRLIVHHAFTTSSQFHETGKRQTVHGSSQWKRSPDVAVSKLIKTCLKKAGSETCHKEFMPGEPLDFTLEEWLSFAGMSLDDRLIGHVTPDVRTGTYAQPRITGVKLHIDLRYEGSLDDDTIVCTVTVRSVEGWNSIGSQVTYRSFKSEVEMEYHDDYKLGVSVEFFPTGVVTRLDWGKAIQTLIAGLVLLGACDAVTGFVAFKVLPEKKVYQNAQVQQLNYGHALARFGINTALACQAFKEWDKTSAAGTEPHLSMQELVHVFEGPFDKETATMFATTVMSQVGKETLVCADLVKLMSSGLCSIETVRKKYDGSKSGSMNQIVPEHIA